MKDRFTVNHYDSWKTISINQLTLNLAKLYLDAGWNNVRTIYEINPVNDREYLINLIGFKYFENFKDFNAKITIIL